MDNVTAFAPKERSVLTMTTFLLTLLGIVIAQFLYQIIYYRHFHPLRHYPGPFWASVTRLWQAWHFYWGSELELERKAIRQHGPIIRVSPTMLLIADSTLIPTIYHRRDTKARFYMSNLWGTSNVCIQRHPAQHAKHRRLVGATYTMSNLQRMEPLMDKHIGKWIRKLDVYFRQQNRPLDLTVWLTFLSCDTFMDIGFRNSLGFIDSASDVGGLIKGLRLGLVVFGTMGCVYKLVELFARSWLRNLVVMRPESNLGFGVLMDKACQILGERTKDLGADSTARPRRGDSSYDLLQAFMDTRTENGEYLDSDAIKAEIFNILGGGVDGFSSTSSALVAETLSNPNIFRRLMIQIKQAVTTGMLTQPVPTYMEVARSLPFYTACVSEALRLHPVVSTILPREVTPTDPEIYLLGRKVPPGTELGCSAWICHRNQEIYGDDAETFNPDRWLSDPAKVKMYEKYSLAWGYGARTCLGKHSAMMMLYKVPVAIFMNFATRLCEDTPEAPKFDSKINGPTLLWENIWVTLRQHEDWSRQNRQDSSGPAAVRTMDLDESCAPAAS